MKIYANIIRLPQETDIFYACAIPTGRDDMLDMEIDAYIHCVSAFIKLAQSEYQLLTEIIPEHHQKKTFDSLIQVSLKLNMVPSFCSCGKSPFL